jgi:hypothetical protein
MNRRNLFFIIVILILQGSLNAAEIDLANGYGNLSQDQFLKEVSFKNSVNFELGIGSDQSIRGLQITMKSSDRWPAYINVYLNGIKYTTLRTTSQIRSYFVKVNELGVQRVQLRANGPSSARILGMVVKTVEGTYSSPFVRRIMGTSEDGPKGWGHETLAVIVELEQSCLGRMKASIHLLREISKLKKYSQKLIKTPSSDTDQIMKRLKDVNMSLDRLEVLFEKNTLLLDDEYAELLFDKILTIHGEIKNFIGDEQWF